MEIKVDSNAKPGDLVELVLDKDGNLVAVPKRLKKTLTGPHWEPKPAKDTE